MSNFAERLQEFFLENGTSVKELSAKYTIDYSSIYGWLRGESFPSFVNLISIADEFGCSMEYLLGRKNEESEFVPKHSDMPFGKKLSAVLKEKGVSVYRLAKDTGISRFNITAWKKGHSQPKVNSLIIVADYLGVTTDYLAGRE